MASSQRLYWLCGLLTVLALFVGSSFTASCPSGPYYPSTQALFPSAYSTWKSRYLFSAAPAKGLRVADPTDCKTPNRTVSEGIGYGLILAVFANDQTTFNGLLTYYNYFRTNESCMPYLIRPDGRIPAYGLECAPDADQDVAFALLVASYKWTTGSDSYYQTALRIINWIYENYVDSATKILMPFGGTTPGSIVNPSYFAPAYYKIFAIHDRKSSHDWAGVASKAVQILKNIRTKNGNTTLVPDWSQQDGTQVSATALPTMQIALKGSYTNGQQTTNKGFATPSSRVTQWPFIIQFLSRPNMNLTYFTLTQVNVTGTTGLDGSALAVYASCQSGTWIKATPQLSGSLPTFYYNKISCTYPTADGIFYLKPVTIRVFTSTNKVYDFKNVDISSYGNCDFRKDSFPFYYGYDAVRFPWRMALDAAYFDDSNSKDSCKALIATTFAQPSYLDGEKYLSGNSLYSSSYGYVFKAPATTCHIINSKSSTRTPIWDALKAGTTGSGGVLPDKTYFGDSLHALAYLFTSGKMTTDLCKLINGAKKTLPAGFSYNVAAGAGFKDWAPATNNKFCLRASNNRNLDPINSWSLAVEFADPNVTTWYDVYINCGGALNQLAVAPIPDLLRTRYITGACSSSTGAVTITLKAKAGLKVSSQVIQTNINTASVRCPSQVDSPKFCWNWSTSQYYLSMTSAWTLGKLTGVCFNNNVTFALEPQNSGNYPYTYAASPSQACPSGGVTINVNNSRVITSQFLATGSRCPFYCFDQNSGKVSSGHKIIAVFQKEVSSVSINCYGTTSGYQTASLQYYQAWGIPDTNCAGDGTVSIKYTYSGAASTSNANYISNSCYPDQDPPGTPPPPPPPPPPPNNLDFLPFCVGVGATTTYLDIRTYARYPSYVTGVSVLCGGVNHVLTQDSSNPEIFSKSGTSCPSNEVQVTLTYTQAMRDEYGGDVTTVFGANLVTNRCSPICFQAPTNQYYLGVGISYVAFNVTISCPSTYTTKTRMTLSGGYFAGIGMSDSENAGLYQVMIDKKSACTEVSAFLRTADQPVGGAALPNGNGYYKVTGSWWTDLAPFTPLPVGDPSRCIR